MYETDDDIIMKAYAEAKLAAFEKGLSGLQAIQAVMAATAKVASRVLGRPITIDYVEDVVRQAQ